MFSTAPFFLRPLREAFAAAADAGFGAVEVMITRDPDSQRAERLSALAAQHDLRIAALHAPFLALTRRVFSTDPIRKVQRTTDIARDLHVPLVVAHPPFRWQHQYRTWLTESLPALTASSGVIITVENMFPLAGLALHGHHRAMDLPRYPDLTLDTSHAAVAKIALEQIPEAHQDRLRHIHLSDNAGKGWDSHAPLGTGTVPIPAFMDALTRNGFNGSIALELDLRRWLDDPAGLRQVLAQQRDLCTSFLPTLTI